MEVKEKKDEMKRSECAKGKHDAYHDAGVVAVCRLDLFGYAIFIPE